MFLCCQRWLLKSVVGLRSGCIRRLDRWRRSFALYDPRCKPCFTLLMPFYRRRPATDNQTDAWGGDNGYLGNQSCYQAASMWCARDGQCLIMLGVGSMWRGHMWVRHHGLAHRTEQKNNPKHVICRHQSVAAVAVALAVREIVKL